MYGLHYGILRQPSPHLIPILFRLFGDSLPETLREAAEHQEVEAVGRDLARSRQSAHSALALPLRATHENYDLDSHLIAEATGAAAATTVLVRQTSVQRSQEPWEKSNNLGN